MNDEVKIKELYSLPNEEFRKRFSEMYDSANDEGKKEMIRLFEVSIDEFIKKVDTFIEETTMMIRQDKMLEPQFV